MRRPYACQSKSRRGDAWRTDDTFTNEGYAVRVTIMAESCCRERRSYRVINRDTGEQVWPAPDHPTP